MTGDQHRNQIGAASLPNGPGRSRSIQSLSYFAVSADLAGWDGEQELPDLLLKKTAGREIHRRQPRRLTASQGLTDSIVSQPQPKIRRTRSPAISQNRTNLAASGKNQVLETVLGIRCPEYAHFSLNVDHAHVQTLIG
jgi:hypothetical protein